MPAHSSPQHDAPAATSPSTPESAAAPTGPFAKASVRAAVSLLLVYHLAAVLLDPLATPPNFAGPPAIIPEAIRPAFQGYVTALSLDHTYKFFAPNPGDSHLFRYDLYFADGTKSVGVPEQTFPDRKKHWPRLLYHRYFMLAEHLPAMRGFGNWNEPDQPPPLQTQASGQGAAQLLPPVPNSPVGEFVPPIAEDVGPRTPGAPPTPGPIAGGEAPLHPRAALAEAYAQGIAAHLAKKHHAQRVDLFHIVHRLSAPQEVIEGRKLSEPDTYRERLIISYKTTEFDKLPPNLGAARRALTPGDVNAQRASEVRR
jgi:hypothetical protein